MTKLERSKTTVDIAVGIVGLLGAIVAAVWGYFEYLDRKAEGRVAETLKFIDRFDRSPVWDARRRIFTVWHRATGDVIRILTKEYTEPKWRKFVNELVENNEIEIDVQTLIDFYESLNICIDEGICDGETAFAFFGEKASLFRNQHFVYLERLRIKLNDPELASKLEAFVRNYKAQRGN